MSEFSRLSIRNSGADAIVISAGPHIGIQLYPNDEVTLIVRKNISIVATDNLYNEPENN